MPTATSIVIRTEEATKFAEEFDLFTSLDVAISHLGRAFPDAERISVDVEQDPNSEYRCLLVDVLVAGDASEVHKRHRECASEVALTLKWPAATLVQTIYSIA